MDQARAFLDECERLLTLVAPLSTEDLRRPTAFKGWTIEDVIGHLHIWNWGADTALQDPAAFEAWLAEVMSALQSGTLRDFERGWLGDLTGPALITAWRDFFRPMAERFGQADPAHRVKWAGPSMSVRSSITARLMETWAHGQEIYDELGLTRTSTDDIQNIVVLGVKTYGWSFQVHGRAVPEPMPYLVLEAPSGTLWTYGEESQRERIEGPAEAFCQVVTQTRNIADTTLRVTGPNATAWMEEAQCFAGPPETPPAPGTRVRRSIPPPGNVKSQA